MVLEAADGPLMKGVTRMEAIRLLVFHILTSAIVARPDQSALPQIRLKSDKASAKGIMGLPHGVRLVRSILKAHPATFPWRCLLLRIRRARVALDALLRCTLGGRLSSASTPMSFVPCQEITEWCYTAPAPTADT